MIHLEDIIYLTPHNKYVPCLLPSLLIPILVHISFKIALKHFSRKKKTTILVISVQGGDKNEKQIINFRGNRISARRTVHDT